MSKAADPLAPASARPGSVLSWPALWLGLTLLTSAAPSRGGVGEPGVPDGSRVTGAGVAVWLESSLQRVFPNTPPGSTNLSLLAPRNGKASFQLCVRNNRPEVAHLTCRVNDIPELNPQVRFVGLVPLPHLTPGTGPSELDGVSSGALPGLVPDPLWPTNRGQFGPFESRSFWVSLRIPAETTPGRREFTVEVEADNPSRGKSVWRAQLPVQLEISPLVVQPRRDFPVTHWWRGEATWDYYKTDMFDSRWWELTRAQLQDMLEHGSDVIYVPVFFNRRETFKRPCQLLVVNETAPGRYAFDWSRVKQFTDMAGSLGFKRFEWPHLWIYWGVKNPMRIYTRKAGGYEMLWSPDISGFSETYLSFLRQFLPEFHGFLARERLLDCSYFHLSDEPGSAAVDNYRRARQFLRAEAPWLKTIDALSDIRYGREGLTDMPVPLVSAAQAYIDAGLPHWVYFCCGPHGPWLNRFCDTPLPKLRMSGWLFYRLQAKGFLHWGFNYWHKLEGEELSDPFNDLSAASYPSIPAGDPFMIYPGPDGKPIDSLRWEVFAESLQDYALLQTAGINPEDPLLADIQSYAQFPKSEAWLKAAREQLLTRAAAH